MAAEQPKITLYTNYLCPYAHRAHITLKELGLSYEEVIIDLDTPREPWYLEINPRGLVPTIKISIPNTPIQDEIITESSIISQFLIDAFPSLSSNFHPSSPDPVSALYRARVAFFADAWNSKIQTLYYPLLQKVAGDGIESQAAQDGADQIVKAVEKELEPLLEGAAPFFGGNKDLTFAEALVIPFVLRISAGSRANIIPSTLLQRLEALPRFSQWVAATSAHPSVTAIWKEDWFVEKMRGRIEKLKVQAQAQAKI